MKASNNLNNNKVCFGSVRFLNEVKYIQKESEFSKLIVIERYPNPFVSSSPSHRSEQEIDEIKHFPHVKLTNNGNPHDFIYVCNQLLKDIGDEIESLQNVN
jgi:hypothetical protein